MIQVKNTMVQYDSRIVEVAGASSLMSAKVKESRVRNEDMDSETLNLLADAKLARKCIGGFFTPLKINYKTLLCSIRNDSG